MTVFRRRRSEDAADSAAKGVNGPDEVTDDEGAEEAAGSEPDAESTWLTGVKPAPRPNGPWDLNDDHPDLHEGRVNLGGLLVPGVDGMELRVEVAGDAIVAATVVLGDSAIQLQAFAAPKSFGLWSEIRAEIAAGIGKQGGTVDEIEGVLGWELHAQVPVRLPNGANGVQRVRFVGCDGERWFLRGVISGQAAAQPQAAGQLEHVFQDTVVVRGDGPMAPRDPIVLKLPEDAQMVPEGGGAAVGVDTEQSAEPSRFSGQAALNPFERGPEITERR